MGQLYDHWRAILGIQKFRRIVSYTSFYCFVSLLAFAYTNNTRVSNQVFCLTRAGISRADQFYASYPAGTELLSDSAKLYKAASANCFEEEEWGPIEFSIMAKHFEQQGKSPYAYHSEEQEGSRTSSYSLVSDRSKRARLPFQFIFFMVQLEKKPSSM